MLPTPPALPPDEDHGAVGGNEVRLVDAGAFFLVAHNRLNAGGNARIRSPVVQQTAQVMVKGGEQAGTDFAVRSDPDARAVAAEGDGNRRDDADLGRAVGEA